MNKHKDKTVFSLKRDGSVADRVIVVREFLGVAYIEALTQSGIVLATATRYTQAKHGVSGWVCVLASNKWKYSTPLPSKEAAIRELRYMTGEL